MALYPTTRRATERACPYGCYGPDLGLFDMCWHLVWEHGWDAAPLAPLLKLTRSQAIEEINAIYVAKMMQDMAD